MSAKLLVRPQYNVGEGPNGYVLKLASINGYTMSDLKKLGLSFAALPGRGLCTSAGLELHRSVRSLAWRLAMAKVHDYRRYCPICLAEGRLAGIECEMAFCNACPVHGVRLRSCCEACKLPTSWMRGRSVKCGCGSDLRSHSTDQASAAEVSVSLALSSAAADGRSSIGAFKNLSLVQWFALLDFFALCYADDFGRRSTGNASLFASDPLEGDQGGADAAVVLADWPKTFLDRVENLRAVADAEQSSRITKAFGPLYRRIYVNLKDDVFGPIRSEFESYIATHWWSGLSTRNSRIGSRRQNGLRVESQWLTIAEVRRELHLSHSAVRTLIEHGVLEGRLDSIGQRAFAYASRTSVARYTGDRANVLSAHDAAAILCCSRERAQEIATALADEAGMEITSSKQPCNSFSRPLLNRLLEIIESLPVLDHLEADQISFDTLLRGSRLASNEVGLLFWKILSGEIKAIGRHQTARQKVREAFQDHPVNEKRMAHGGLAGLIFHKPDIEAIHQRRQALTELSIQEVASRLSVKESVAYHLVKRGLLSYKKSVERFPRKLVDEVTLQRFQRDYVLAPAAAHTYGISSIALRRHLARAGVHPVCASDTDGCRLLIFANDQAYRIATKGLLRASSVD